MSKISIREEGKDRYDENEYFSGSQILNHDYQDKLTNIFIDSHCSLNGGERMRLADNIHQVRKIFSEHTDNTISSMWINVFCTEKLDIDKFKEAVEMRASKIDWKPYWKGNIHVRFGNVQDKVLVYSWLDINQFNQDKWNNLLSQLEGDYKINLIGTGPLTFKYKDFNYLVYPPLFGSSDDEESFLNDHEVFNFSPTEVNKIIEDIKESHQSIKKKIIDHYQSLGKNFAKNNEGYIEIKAGIDENNVKNFTDVSYTNGSDDIYNEPIKEAFIKEEERNNVGNFLHLAVYTNSESLMEQFLGVTDVNEVNKNDRTPLHLAAKYGRKDMVEMLLNKEAKVDVVDNRGRTPLHLAAQYNEKKEIVEMLLNKEAKVDIADNRGRTPLHLAAQNNNKEIVEALIKAKANVNIKDEDGNTPLGLTTNEEIKTLLKAAEKSDDGSAGGSSTDSEGGQEEEKRVGDDTELQSDHSKEGKKPSTTSAEQGTVVSNGSQPTGSKQNNEGQTSNTSAGQGTDVQDNGVNHVASTEPAQTEEQPSSFFGSLFSILMKPFSLVASFFGGFFSWLFGSDEEKSDTQPYDDSSSPRVDQSVEQNNGDHNDQSNVI